MVRSAPKSVSNTLSKPSIRRAADHLALHIGSDGKAKFFAQRCPDRRSGLHYHIFIGIGNGIEYSAGTVFLCDGACGTYGDTLSAGHTACGLASPISKAEPMDVAKPLLIGTDDADALYLGTHGCAASAEDTFAVVTDHMCRRLSSITDWCHARRRIFSVVLTPSSRQSFMQLTVAVSHTGQTVFCL